jgi:hypothetical protein
MTATTTAAAPAPERVPRRRGVAVFVARLVRMEIRHSAYVWVLPLLAILFICDPFRTANGYPAVWTVRASVVQHMFPDFLPFAAGFSAWTGSREGRRRIGYLLATTARSAWTRQFFALAGTLFWVVASFLAAVVVLYVRTAMITTWGGPPLWPVIVSTVELTTICVIAFTAGALFPGRFTAPIVAVGLFLLSLIGFREAVTQHNGIAVIGITVLSPNAGVPSSDAGVFYPVAPDVSIVQVMFMGGLVLAALGVLGLSSRTGGAGWSWAARQGMLGGARLRAVAAGMLAVGTAAAVVGAALASTSTFVGGNVANGVEIPALHDAASDRPIPYTPVCESGSDGFQICVHPAYRMYLSESEAALAPVVAEIAGLPGAPAQAAEVADRTLPVYAAQGGYLAGDPPVYEFSYNYVLSGSGQHPAIIRSVLQQDLVDAFLAGPPTMINTGDGTQLSYGPADPAQYVVTSALLAVIDWQPSAASAQASIPQGATAESVQPAVKRFAALPAATRHAWLGAHLAALRAGQVTLAEIP